MTTIDPVNLEKGDGTAITIEIEPASYEDEGQSQASGVYLLTARPYRPAAEAGKDDEPLETIAAGEIAMHQDDPYEWEYIGDYLNVDEQEQVVQAILSAIL